MTDQATASGPAAPEDATWAPSTAGKLVNFGVFQIVWFVCVYGAAEGNPWVGPLSAAVLLPINLRFTPHRGAELRLWALAGLVGLLLDTALRTVGWVAFPAAGGGSVGALLLAPAWIGINTPECRACTAPGLRNAYANMPKTNALSIMLSK